MRKTVKMLILLFMMMTTLQALSQENKEIKMEVFEKNEEVLPFAAVDRENRAVTDLSKGEIVVLLNGRNFRDFSLVYPSKRGSRYPDLAGVPKDACYDITIAYVSNADAAREIRLGTTRKGVRLHTLKSLYIKKLHEQSDGQTEETPAVKTEGKAVSVRVSDIDTQGTGSDIPKEQPGIPAAPTTSTLPLDLSSETKSDVFKRLEKNRFNFTDTASINYFESALQYLRQDRIKDARFYFAKLTEHQDNEKKRDEWLQELIEKIGRIDQASEKMLDKMTEFSKIPGTFPKITVQENSNLKKGLSLCQELLDKTQTLSQVVASALDHLPVILEIQESRVFQRGKNQGLAPMDQPSRYYRERLELFKSYCQQLEERVFIQSGRLKIILDRLDQLLTRESMQREAVKQYILDLQKLDSKENPAELADFVTANGNKFSSEFKVPFFKVKLETLGAAPELLAQPSFFDVVTCSHSISRNSQGYWEAGFPYGITMIYIPPGEFTMGVPWETGGAEDESPQHNVYLDGCWISKYEITFNQYDQFCRETGRKLFDDYGRGRKKQPVIGVSWQDSQDFCLWLSHRTGLYFRLPTEAEWEKAALGSQSLQYPWGNQNPDGNHANFADVNFLKKYLELNPPLDEQDRKQKTDWIDSSIDDGHVFTAPVGSFPQGASPYGVMDMAGNVWEWVSDWYDDDYYQRSPSTNPPGVSFGKFRVVRGGGWDCHPWLLRTTGRAGCDPNKGNDSLGFRIAIVGK